MSVTVALYEYEESMDDEILASMGVKGGIIGKLQKSDISLEEERELLDSTDSYSVGSSNYEFPRRILDEVNGLTEVDEIFLSMMEAAAEKLAEEDEGYYSSKETIEWLKEREGEKIFAQGL